jgi:hypothetical protein
MGEFMVSIIYGGITHHYINSHYNYCNSLNNFGTIHNEYVIAMAGSSDVKFGFLKGKDSACGDIFGPISSFKMNDSVDFMLGGYNANYEDFEKLGMVPFSVAGVTPVIGLNFKLSIYKTPYFDVTLNNLVSVGIITHALSLDF